MYLNQCIVYLGVMFMYYYTLGTLNLRIHETYVCCYGPVVDITTSPPYMTTLLQFDHT